MTNMKFRAWNGEYFEFSEFNFKTGCLGCNFSTYVEIDTPQLFAGLQDTKGSDIYVGDFVYLSGYGLYECKLPFLELYDAYSEGDIGEVKGNIYENKELANEKAQ